MKSNITLIVVAFALILCLVLLSDPFMLFMPEAAVMAIHVGVTVLLCVWAGFVIREQATDEREVMHRMNAGRIAYLSGIGVLTVALLVQGFAHDVDPWIALALAAMVLSKLGAHLYADKYQ